jgi:4-azaleucine resistance transporter AzlC
MDQCSKSARHPSSHLDRPRRPPGARSSRGTRRPADSSAHPTVRLVDQSDEDQADRDPLADSLGIALSAGGFGIVYGLAARAAGFSPLDATAMSLIVFAGGAQFAAVAYVHGGMPWPALVLLTGFVNARHILYGTVLAPYLAGRSRALRLVMAHVLDDETVALSIAHFRRIGHVDVSGYWVAAIVGTFLPWTLATAVGVTIAGTIPDPSRLGLDVIFPAAMAGLAVGLVSGRPEIAAVVVGVVVAVAVSLMWRPAAGILASGLSGLSLGWRCRAERLARLRFR